jgi:1L-myo-inositol 1-phosphate cytidylyltransferase
VVLAAGNGSRLASVATLPKPMLSVGGRPLLTHVIDGLEAAGIERIHVIIGYGSRALRACPGIDRPGLEVRWIENPRYAEPNGLSLLCGRGSVAGAFMLAMGDHLFDRNTVRRFSCEVPPDGGGVLAVDRQVGQVFDPDDATRVKVTGSLVEAIAKGLDDFNAVDTGMFVLTPAVFEAMDESVRLGDASLSGGIRRLAERGRMRAWDIDPGRWIDVDTPRAAAEADRLVDLGVVGTHPTSA